MLFFFLGGAGKLALLQMIDGKNIEETGKIYNFFLSSSRSRIRYSQVAATNNILQKYTK